MPSRQNGKKIKSKDDIIKLALEKTTVKKRVTCMICKAMGAEQELALFELNQKHGLGYRAISQFFNEAFNLEITPWAVRNHLENRNRHLRAVAVKKRKS